MKTKINDGFVNNIILNSHNQNYKQKYNKILLQNQFHFQFNIFKYSYSTQNNKFTQQIKQQNQNKKKIFTEDERKQQEENNNKDNQGTYYTTWLLTRSLSHNHSISHLKRAYLKDRYSIHKLTNIQFLCSLANHKTQFTLNTNQKIILLAQLNHVFNLLKKQKCFYNQFKLLRDEIMEDLKDPKDLVCLGTFLAGLCDIGCYEYDVWLGVMDSLLVRKADEEYDQLFGIISSLNQYKQFILQFTPTHTSTANNMILQFIPVIYRNHLQLLRQFIKFNIYNLKQCRILLSCLNNKNKINEKYFWSSVNDWFNLYIKQQIQKKSMDQFFILSQSAIDKVINDDGMIRSRPILQELTQVAYIIGQNLKDKYGRIKEEDKKAMKRYLQFVEDLVLYAIENGSILYGRYLDNHVNNIKKDYKKQQNGQKNFQSFSDQTQSQSSLQKQQKKFTLNLNQQFKTKSLKQQYQIFKMQKKYKTIFINPIQIKNESIIQLIICMKICCGYADSEVNNENEQANKSQQNIVNDIEQHQQNPISEEQKSKQKSTYKFSRPQHLIHINVLKWLVMRLCKHQMNYTISQLLQIIKAQDFLSFARINLDQLIVQKLKYLRSKEVSLDDLKKLMLFLPLNEFVNLQEIMLNFLQKAHPSQILQLTRIIQSQSVSQNDEQYPQSYPRKPQQSKWLPHLNFYFLRLPQLINFHYKYYSFQQNCYFLYYLLKSQVYWQKFIYSNQNNKNQAINYLGEMEKLKECVKIASYSRGFKLQMNSYFYKLLNYVDLVEFFEGGNLR